MTDLDPRLHAYRSDLADERLAGQVQAQRFVAGTDRQVTAALAPIRRAPRADAPLDTEALLGERVRVFDEQDGWAWGQLATDGYVGWIPAERLGPPGPAATHRVSALRTFVYRNPDTKSPPIAAISMNGLVAVSRSEAEFAVTGDGYVVARHLAPLDTGVPDWVAVAERFVGTPYLWGGRSSLGLDCSALVQLALIAAGISCPRDSDMQAKSVGESVGHDRLEALERGDLVFWKGHVGIAAGGGQLLHANGHHMETVIEPVSEAVSRIAESGLEVTGVRRLAKSPT